MKPVTIVYMVAGMSSRFNGKVKQLIKVTPKETLIEYSTNQALFAGFNKIIFIVGAKTKQSFKQLFKNNYKGIPVEYVYQTFNPEQRDKPWGTTDALCSAKHLLKEPFVICNGDDIYGKDVFKKLFNHLQENYDNNESATIGYKLIDVIPEKGGVNRGIFKVKDNYAKGLVETFNIEKYNLEKTNTTPEDLCSMNIFALHPQTLNILDHKLQEFKQKYKTNQTIESLLPEEISKLIKNNSLKMKLFTTFDKWLGVTNPEDEQIIKEKIKDLN